MVSFRVIPSGVIRTIEMVSPVRQSTSASIKVENPLPYSVTFSTDCRVPDISLPSQFVVPANSEVSPGSPRGPLLSVTEALPTGPLDLWPSASLRLTVVGEVGDNPSVTLLIFLFPSCLSHHTPTGTRELWLRCVKGTF